MIARAQTTALVLLAVATMAGARAAAQPPRRLGLADALAIAAARRSELKQADVDVLRAQLGLLRARLEHVRLTVQASFSEQLQALDVNAPHDFFAYQCQLSDACRYEAHTFNGVAALTVPVFSGLQIESDVARARALERAAREGRRAVWLGIAVELADSYWTVRRAELTAALLEQALVREQEIEQATKARVDAGIAPMVDYDRAHLLVLRQRAEIKSVAEARGQALAVLGNLLQLDEELELTDDPPATPAAAPPLADAEREALASRPELRAATATVDAGRLAVRAAQGAYWPQLALVGNAAVSNQPFYLPQFTTVTTETPRREVLVGNFFVGAQLSWTVFDMLQTWTNVRDAGYVRDRLEQDRVRARYAVLADVRAAHQRLQRESERLALVQASARVAQDAVDSLRRRYRVGNAAIFELTAAEDTLVSVASELIATRIAIAQAEAELRAAMGRL
jgi:outer membrane protein TolC